MGAIDNRASRSFVDELNRTRQITGGHT
jgi:hypothetical protein